MILSQYALLGPGRELPEVETNIHGLGLKNIFSSRSTGNGDLFSTDLINQNSVQTYESEDYYVKVNAVTNNTHGITVGRADDVMDSTAIVSDDNSTSDVEFVFSGKEGSYKVTYSIGDQSFMDGFGKDPSGKINLRIVSTRRTGNDDNVAIKLHVTNNSDIPLNISVEGEDRENPRIDIVEKNGEVSVND